MRVVAVLAAAWAALVAVETARAERELRATHDHLIRVLVGIEPVTPAQEHA